MNMEEIEEFSVKFNNSDWSDYAMFYQRENYRLKCFSNKTGNEMDKEDKPAWKYPFVDLHLMLVEVGENATGVELVDPGNRQFHYPLDDIYPLTRTKLEEIDVYVPFNVENVLSQNYKLRRCLQNNSIDNQPKENQSNNTINVACNALADFVDFTNII